MTSYPDWKAVAHAIGGYLEGQLKEPPHAVTFARWRGVQVLVPEDDKPAPRVTRDTQKQPQIIITLERDEASRSVRVASARDLLLNIQVRANEFTGAAPAGAALSSDTLLSRALTELLDEGRKGVQQSMRARELYAVRLTSRTQSTQAVPGAAQQHTDPHRLSLTYFQGE